MFNLISYFKKIAIVLPRLIGISVVYVVAKTGHLTVHNGSFQN